MAIYESRKKVGQDRSKIDLSDRVEDIEKEIRETPYHKGTEHHIGKLRARLSKLRDQIQESSAQKGGGGGGYAVKKQGDATVILIGPPSAGKSTLLNKLTNAQSKVAPYAFTTVSVIPGMMEYKYAKIQILDVPGLIEGAEEGKGRGKEVLSVARGADLIVLITDINRIDAIERIKSALHRNGIRLNIVRPSVKIDKMLSGGIIIHSNIKQDLTNETIKSVIAELGIKNAEVFLNEKLTIESLIDAFSPNRVYSPSISVINKADLLQSATNDQQPSDTILISVEKNIGLEELKETIWNRLNFLTVYLVRPDQEPSTNNPVVTKKGQTLLDVAMDIGTEFAEGKKRAKIWGTGAKFSGQEVSLKTEVQEGMQIRFITQ